MSDFLRMLLPDQDSQGQAQQPPAATHNDHQISYTRFDVVQRIEHLIFLISFTILGITGLAQKFSSSPLS